MSDSFRLFLGGLLAGAGSVGSRLCRLGWRLRSVGSGWPGPPAVRPVRAPGASVVGWLVPLCCLLGWLLCWLGFGLVVGCRRLVWRLSVVG